MYKEYNTAPLPFMGQKRMFVREYKKVLSSYPEDVTIVDLFGGSGLLSHVAKHEKPRAKVVYNDYDGYHVRLANIGRTNALLRQIRQETRGITRHSLIPYDVREKIFKLINGSAESGYVDYITLSSSLLFSMKYAVNMEQMKKQTLYNNVRDGDYSADGYLDGLTIVCQDYKELFDEYRNADSVLFLVDPPYLSTDVCTYRMSWKLKDYLNVLTVLEGTSYIYFTSNKSSIVELCEWIGTGKVVNNPFADAHVVTVNNHMNYNAQYTDMMLYRKVS
jgi:site-specific DNA-adenine methylase